MLLRIQISLALAVCCAVNLSHGLFAQSPALSSPTSQVRMPVDSPVHSAELSAFSRHSAPDLAGYKVIAGPKVQEANHMKSPYDHLPMQVVTPQPFAYGWFGSVPYPQWSRQLGYGRRYTQWSLK